MALNLGKLLLCVVLTGISALLSGVLAEAAQPPVTAACFAPDGRVVVTGSQAGIELRSWPGLEVQRRLTSGLAHVHDLVFSPSGKWLAAVGGRPGETGEIEFYAWPVEGVPQHGVRDAPQHLVRHAEDVFYQLAWDERGARWTAANGDGRLYRGAVGLAALEPLLGHSRGVLTVAAAGEWLFSAGIDRSVRVWNVELPGSAGDSGSAAHPGSAGPPASVRSLDNHTATVYDLAVRPSTDAGGPVLLASASEDRTIRFWQPAIGRLVRFARLPSAALAIDWLPDGSRLLAACVDGHVRVIDPQTVNVVADIPALPAWAYALAVAPDGDQALVGGPDGTVHRLLLKGK